MAFFTKKTPPKKRIFNPLEQLTDLGKDTAKKAVTEVIGALNPFSDLFGGEAEKMRSQGKNDFSDLNVQKLQSAYAQDDQEEINRLQRLLHPEQFEEQDEKQEEMNAHRRVQREEEEFNLKEEQEEEEEKRQEAMEEQQKKQAEAAQNQHVETPKGKVRKSVLGGAKRKASSELPTEFRPDAGKQ
ncbi:hypothetical protein KBD81_05295 [Candidatus Woesebacteria bacterium]|nr:hypothetical protein [Candidatus Woesebacteria bacterium]